MVIGITHDPATPYQNAVAMSELLARARLLTVDGYGHGTFGQSCTFPYLTSYLIDQTLPPRGTRCLAACSRLVEPGRHGQVLPSQRLRRGFCRIGAPPASSGRSASVT